MKNLSLFSIIILFVQINASTQTLDSYREKALETIDRATLEDVANRSGLDANHLNPDILKFQADDRVKKLRELMGTSNFQIPQELIGLGLVNNRGKKPSASDFLKRFTREGINTLKEIQLYSKPETFDPSDFEFERATKEDKRVFDAFNKVVEERIGGGSDKFKFRDLALNFYSKHVKDERPEENIGCSDLSDVVETFYPDEILDSHSGPAKLLSDYIKNQSPDKVERTLHGDPRRTSIIDVLGNIRRLDVVNGKVRRLKITTCAKIPFGAKASLLSKEETTVTLGILINIVTGLDAFFLKTQDYFIKMIEDLRMPLLRDTQRFYGLYGIVMEKIGSQSTADLEIYNKILEVMKQRQDGARFIHTQLMSLTRSQQLFLLDMLLQLQTGEVPAKADIALLAEARIKMTSAEENKFKSPRDMKDQAEFIADIDYFSNLDTDIGYLEDFLTEEQANNRAVEAAIKQIGGQ